MAESNNFDFLEEHHFFCFPASAQQAIFKSTQTKQAIV